MNEQDITVLSEIDAPAGYVMQSIRSTVDGVEIDSTRTVTDIGDVIGTMDLARVLYREFQVMPIKSKDLDDEVSIGYSDYTGQWYGWYNGVFKTFTTGSTIYRNDIGYQPTTIADLRSYLEDFMVRLTPRGMMASASFEEIHEGIVVRRMMLNNQDDMENMAKEIEKCGSDQDAMEAFFESKEGKKTTFRTGKGEWTAITDNDAREMAIAFADNLRARAPLVSMEF